MAAIFRVKNKYGYSYKVLIRNKGLKDVIKTFKKRELAVQFINQVESNRELRISYSNNDLTLNDLITEYLNNIYKGTRPKTENRRLQYWIDKLGYKKVSEVSKFDVMEAFNHLPQKFLILLRTDINQLYHQSLVMQSEPMIYRSIQLVLFNHWERE